MLNRTFSDANRLKNYYSKNKKKVLKHLLLFTVFFSLTLVIVGLRLFYPYHLLISVLFLITSLYFLIGSLLFNRKKVAHSKTFKNSKNIIFRYRVLIIVFLITGSIFYALSTLSPTDQNLFENMDDATLSKMIEEDLQVAVILMDSLELSGDDLIESPLLDKASLSIDEKNELQEKWNTFLKIAIESEKLTDVHRYFNRIRVFSNKDEHMQSFIIAYSLYIKKYELFHRLIVRIGGNENLIKALNEYSQAFENKNSYDDVLDRFFSSDSYMRRSAGRIYIVFLDIISDKEKLEEGYLILKEESLKSYSYLISHLFDTTIHAAKKGSKDLEITLYGAWFPVQKNVANTMGEIYVSSRNEKLISVEQIETMKKVMQPGDIMVQRRNWYASNLGIPGFWPHAALYIGTLSELESYYNSQFPMEGYSNLRELIHDKYPKLYEKYNRNDEKGYLYSVIEAKAPGVILQSLEESAHADYVGVLRPRLSKKDSLNSVLRAFENFGKPYDYNFDFENLDELVCSEVVYDAYLPSRNKSGLSFESSMVSGRRIVSANSMVKKFSDERYQDDMKLTFVYFLDGDEELGKAFVGDEESFADSWSRPKYSWLLE